VPTCNNDYKYNSPHMHLQTEACAYKIQDNINQFSSYVSETH